MEELILNVTVFFVRFCRRSIKRGTDTECYCVCCERLAETTYRGNNTEYYCFVVSL